MEKNILEMMPPEVQFWQNLPVPVPIPFGTYWHSGSTFFAIIDRHYHRGGGGMEERVCGYSTGTA